MRENNDAAVPSLTALVRQEWTVFRSRGRIVTMVAATLVVILVGLLAAVGTRTSCSMGEVEVACPVAPVGPHGAPVSDQFSFAHRPMGDNGSITVRMTSMTGIITYPPPNHDEIVPGLVPWAKAGVIIKDGTAPGSSYAALMMTGGHGVRLQHDYVHDTAGAAGGVSPDSPRWLRLTRSGDVITGYESTDGTRWATVGTARLPGLPTSVQVGLFATSPGDLTLRPIGLGGRIAESRFTQTTAVFDTVTLAGAPAGDWDSDPVGEQGMTDWERSHRPAGLVESNGTLTVTGSGDIGPVSADGGRPVESTLLGVVLGLLMVVVVAVRSGAAGLRSARNGATPPGGRVMAAGAAVTGAVGLAVGLLAAGVAVVIGTAILRAGGTTVLPVSALTHVRVVLGVGALVAVAAVLAFAIGALVRRTWVAILVAVFAVVVPYAVSALPLLPDEVSRWLLRLTPAAGFAVQQTISEYPQVLAHYAPSAGYFPLPWWAGFAVLCGYAALVLGLAMLRSRRRDAVPGPPSRWR